MTRTNGCGAAAIKRLHQLENILKVYASESDTEVRTLLEDRIRQLASSSHESRPPLELRMQVVESTSDRDLIEHLAQSCTGSSIASRGIGQS